MKLLAVADLYEWMNILYYCVAANHKIGGKKVSQKGVVSKTSNTEWTGVI